MITGRHCRRIKCLSLNSQSELFVFFGGGGFFIPSSGISSIQNGSRERGFRRLIEKQRTVTMALLAHRINLDYRREDIKSMTSQMENLEQEMAEAKSSFCEAQNNLLFFTESYKLPNRKAILDTLGSLDKWSERAMETMSTL